MIQGLSPFEFVGVVTPFLREGSRKGLENEKCQKPHLGGPTFKIPHPYGFLRVTPTECGILKVGVPSKGIFTFFP